jgi:hypothetical protein
MSVSSTLDHQINQAAFWSAAIALGTGVVAFFLPLDAPGGYEATTSERVAWLAANSGSFIIGWINQIVAMISLSGVFAGIAWQIAGTHPLRAILAATLVAISMVVFFIPKFIAVWTIPMLAEAIATGSAVSDMAETLLPILNVTVPFSLYTSFDYLGFWLYSLFALLVGRPLLRGSPNSEALRPEGKHEVIHHTPRLSQWGRARSRGRPLDRSVPLHAGRRAQLAGFPTPPAILRT